MHISGTDISLRPPRQGLVNFSMPSPRNDLCVQLLKASRIAYVLSGRDISKNHLLGQLHEAAGDERLQG